MGMKILNRCKKKRKDNTNKSKSERNLFGYLKNLFYGRRDKLKSKLWPELSVLVLEYQTK